MVGPVKARVRVSSFRRCVLALAFAPAFAWGMSTTASAAAPSLGPIPAFLQKHCVSCHGDEQPKAGLGLGGIRSHAQILKQRKVWENLADMVEAELMPPEDKPQLSKAEIAVIRWWIEKGAPASLPLSAAGAIPDDAKQAVADK